MRKDVKIGFAIGGVLLSVLIVYVLVVSGGSTSADMPQQVALVTPDKTPPAVPSAMAAPAPDQQPVQRRNRTQARQPNENAQAAAPKPEVPAEPVKPATVPSAAPAETAAAPSIRDEWSAALHAGLPALMTTTPTSRPAATPAPVAADANLPTPPAGSSANAVTPIFASAASNAPAVTEGGAIPIRVSSPTTRGSESRAPQIPAISSGAAADSRTHVVQAGETYSSIAAMVYGSSALYPALVRANPAIDAKKLRPGMTINIPPVSEVKGDSTPAAASAAPAAASPAAVATLPKIDEKTEYRVESGDSLYKISAKLYGKVDRFEKIYDLNKAAIGPDMTKLKVGMVLKLPEAPTVK